MKTVCSRLAVRLLGNRAFATLLPLFFTSAAVAQHSPIKSDEQITFFPTVGRIETDGTLVLPIHGWIYEPETNSIRRNILLSSLCRALSLLDASCDSDVFKTRARYFLTDNESGKSIPLTLGSQSVVSSPSGSEGHFRAEIRLTEPQSQPAGQRQELRYRALTRPSDPRIFEGRVLALEKTGISVISDIDDTVKVSNVLDRQELLLNSFVRPFKAVTGMPELYRSWSGAGATFHYLSASPWQLYPAFEEFFAAEKLPLGSFHLKVFRWKDTRFFDLFVSPELFKPPIIESLLNGFPDRRFVFVGDSGERDIEIYGAIARRFPKQDIRIVIRELAEAKIDPARRDRALESVPPERWKIVSDTVLADPTGRQMLTEFISR